MTEFKDLNKDDQANLIRRILQCNTSKNDHKIDTEIFRQECALNNISPQDIPNDLDVRYQFDYQTRHQIHLLQSTIYNIMGSADITDVKPYAPEPEVKAGHSPLNDVMENLWRERFYLMDDLPQTQRTFIAAIDTNEVHHFLFRFFRKSDHRKLEPETVDNYTLDLCSKLRKAVLTGKNISLQGFYDHNAPRQLRGKLKDDSNPTFKDTNELINFLENCFFFFQKKGDQND